MPSDPRKQDRIVRYKPSKDRSALDDPMPEYMNLLAMVFSVCGLLLKASPIASSTSTKNVVAQMKWAAWAAVYCSFISFANSRNTDDGKQLFSSFMYARIEEKRFMWNPFSLAGFRHRQSSCPTCKIQVLWTFPGRP